jgi:hypothetical protein
MSFTEIAEEIYALDYDNKLELKTLLEKYLIEDRRNEILKQHQEALDMANRGELVFSDNSYQLIKDLKQC